MRVAAITRVSSVLVLAVSCAIVTAGPVPARACENAILVELDRLVRRIDDAEQTLLAGRTREAMRGGAWALRVLRGADHGYFLELDGAAAERRARTLRSRASRVLAVAVVRRDGNVDRRRWVPTSRIDDATRRANLEWARSLLEEQARAGEPIARARYAEALARFPSRRDDARQILTELAGADLVPDAWGYRVLAELGDQIGDRALRDRSIGSCHARAGALATTICPRLVAVR